MIFDLDMDKCVACGACAVACMDQNDLRPQDGEELFRTVGVVEPLPGGKELGFLSLGCMHCADAPCITACPTGCLRKDALGLTVYDNSLCIGCHSCAMACPFGIPRFSPKDGKMLKCDGCYARVENGMQPACVRACAFGALTCVSEEEFARLEKENSITAMLRAVNHL